MWPVPRPSSPSIADRPPGRRVRGTAAAIAAAVVEDRAPALVHGAEGAMHPPRQPFRIARVTARHGRPLDGGDLLEDAVFGLEDARPRQLAPIARDAALAVPVERAMNGRGKRLATSGTRRTPGAFLLLRTSGTEP